MHVFLTELTVFQLSAQTSEKDVALQQIALLQNQMRKSEQKVQELEAVKEQLEQDSFSTHTRYQELEELNRQVHGYRYMCVCT